jgi:glycosyltransferase involved in cell wall biosynthesis
MKIAIWHNLPSGGGKRALYDHVRGLLGRGHHIEAWCPPSADQTYLPLAELIPEHVVKLAMPGRADWDRRLRIPSPVAPRLAAMEAHCRACGAAISAGGFDLLVAHPCLFFRTSPIGHHVRLPTVLYLQEPYRGLYEALPRLPWLAPPPSTHAPLSLGRLREVALDRRTLRNARLQGRAEVDNAAAFDRILVNSLFSRESLLRAYGLESEVCYLGADLSRFADHGWPRENLLVGLGSFTPEKNPRLAIEALALLPPPRPELAWIGNVDHGGTLADMTALAASLDVPFTPHLRIADDALIALLNRASALLYAPRLEPFGLAPIEAAACGLPAIAVAEGGVRETVIDDETGLLVRHDPAAMAAAIARLLADPALARRLGAAARARAERHWSQAAATDRVERALLRSLAR